MDKICIKTANGYEQSGIALSSFLKSKNIDNDVIIDAMEYSHKRHLYSKIYELDEIDCVNTSLFKRFDDAHFMDTIYYGTFDFNKLLEIDKICEENTINYLHIYGENRWPIHNFVGLIDYQDLGELSTLYNRFLFLKNDPKWIYMSFLYVGCKPIVEYDIKIYTDEDYAKELKIV